MNKIYLLGIAIIALAGCTAENGGGKGAPTGGTSIQGTLTASENQMLILEELTTGKPIAMDTADLDAEGSFAFSLEVPKTGFYRLNISNQNYVPLILSPKEQVNVNIDAKRKYTVAGSDESARLQELSNLVSPLDSLQGELQIAQQNADQNRYYTAMAQMNVTRARISGKIKAFIESKPGSLASIAALNNLDPEQFFSTYDMVSKASNEAYPDSPYTQNLNTMVSGMRALAVGAPAPEISLPNLDGQPIALSSLKGKVVLVDFWASWCKPCRKENPNVVRLYNAYKEKGFEVFSVSLDGLPQQPDGKSAWAQAIQQDQLSWPSHVSDLKGWSSSVVPLYNVKGIPLTFLIDREGNIIGKNLRGPGLENKLSEIFGG